jgi:5-(carboxyamino)imidazole ribonucleotide mutase
MDFHMTETVPVVSVVMGSRSDWETMSEASAVLEQFGIRHECLVVSAHRTPLWMSEFALSAAARGIRVVVAGAGGAAHLPGMIASMTELPVLGVPVQSKSLNGLDSLLSIVQMPGGVPVGTLAIGRAGAKNAGLLAVRILSLSDEKLAERLRVWMREQTDNVLRDCRLPGGVTE